MTDYTLDTFLRSAATANMQSAYLILCGRLGVSKRLTDRFLMKLYCKKGGCGVCTDCCNVVEGHVDILRLTAPKVREFREAISFVAEKPVYGYKSVVIEDADDMTDSAANSMLKTLENPPKNTIFILQARSITGVLPTVASRCTVVHIKPDFDTEDLIMKNLGVDAAEAHILCYLSGGFADEASLIFNDTDFWSARCPILDICSKLLYQRGMGISLHTDFLESKKVNLVPLLCIMQSYYRDILIYKKTGNEFFIKNSDRADEIIKASSDFTSGAISNIINVILETERRFFFSVNFRLTVEKMLFDILEEKNKWKKL